MLVDRGGKRDKIGVCVFLIRGAWQVYLPQNSVCWFKFESPIGNVADIFQYYVSTLNNYI